jgi:hypothetical protein
VTTSARAGRGAAILAVVAVVVGCSLPGTVGDDAMRLEMSNGTTIPVLLVVNGEPGREVPAAAAVDLGTADVGPLPWDASVRTMSGRLLLQLTVHAGDVSYSENGDGSSSARGVGVRTDLSCGRIDLWSGPPMMGPAPGPGAPGDCDP